jgi:hypothetical protein
VTNTYLSKEVNLLNDTYRTSEYYLGDLLLHDADSYIRYKFNTQIGICPGHILASGFRFRHASKSRNADRRSAPAAGRLDLVRSGGVAARRFPGNSFVGLSGGTGS